MTKSLTIRIDQVSEQVSGPVRKLIGLLSPKTLVQLLDTDDLAANPRSAKKGPVTEDIEDTLRTGPELFPAKTKGILLASSSYKSLERDRYQLTLLDPETEGILDGGHNAFAAGRYILGEAGMSQSELGRIRDWESFRAAWIERRSAIGEVIELIEFQMPVEVQVPAAMNDDEVVETFRASLLEIGAARNNNVQLSEETKAHKKGLYDALKEHLPGSLAKDVEWKTNDGGRIKVRDIIAISWVPLSKLSLPDNIRVNPNQIYRNKAVCVSAFNRLLNRDDISEPASDGYARTLKDPSVKSAIQISGVLPELYDQLYSDLPAAYNKAGGSFGKINAVKIYDPDKAAEKSPKFLRAKPMTPFYRRECQYTCPDGFIVPVLYGMRALLAVDNDGLLGWKVNPQTFLSRHLVDVMKSYRLVMEMATFDPQKVGKNISAYEFAESTIAAIMTRSA